MKKTLRKVYWFLVAQLGIDLKILFYSFIGVPQYLKDLYKFKRTYNGIIKIMPCLHDRYEEGGTTKTEYFWQDLYVAQKIYHSCPEKHVDVGSRMDGFVAHVASFRPIEVFDIRRVESAIPNVTFTQADLTKPLPYLQEYCDSLSCLHALEHFGLGRYGDSIDSDGYKSGLCSMAGLLKNAGLFYLATPIGKPQIFFNAHRVFDPRELRVFVEELGFELVDFAWFGSEKKIINSSNVDLDFDVLAGEEYSLGIFTFIKRNGATN